MPNLIAIVIAALIALVSSSGAHAACPAGKTFTGTCVDPGVATSAQANVKFYTQARLSRSAPPIRPSTDRDFLDPRFWPEKIFLPPGDAVAVPFGGGFFD
jgi:hypothetical protein